MKQRVIVAMSGGVDSSVAAALLVDQGYEVSGVMLRLWADDCGEKDNSCCPPEAISQARQVASILGIPFYVLDVRELFKTKIVDTFIQDYSRGLTPNPCFNCNRWIRWGYLLNFATSNGFEFLATGHYARIERDRDGKVRLIKGIDETKDQSYVLSGLDQSQLEHTLLPLGTYRKSQVRAIAAEKGLPVAEKHDSQDLCFVGKSGYRDFIRRHAPESLMKGEIINTAGKRIGEHEGLANYTIGQRKGLGAGNAQPIYVIKKDVERNQLVVGWRNELGTNAFIVERPHFLGEEITAGKPYKVKVRYKAAPVECRVQLNEYGSLNVATGSFFVDATPGQIAVLYDGDQVIASGAIS